MKEEGEVEGLNLIHGAEAAAAKVASALMPKRTVSAKAAEQTGSSQNNTDATADGSTITSSDFLVLLVTEMKNQDPTQPTDPNAYIQQLVEVNSLQQLISINKNLTPASTGTSTTGT